MHVADDSEIYLGHSLVWGNGHPGGGPIIAAAAPNRVEIVLNTFAENLGAGVAGVLGASFDLRANAFVDNEAGEDFVVVGAGAESLCAFSSSAAGLGLVSGDRGQFRPSSESSLRNGCERSLLSGSPLLPQLPPSFLAADLDLDLDRAPRDTDGSDRLDSGAFARIIELLKDGFDGDAP